MTEPSRRDRLCRLLEPHHDELRAFSARLCKSTADGDDLFHEAVVRALVKIDHLREDKAFRWWFYRVLITVHRNRTRRGLWSRLVPLGAAHEIAEPPADIGGAQRMRLALAALPAEQREAIVLHELQGMTTNEIARLQRVSGSAVKSRLSRGRRRLQTIYRKRFHIEEAPAKRVLSET